MIDHMSSRTIVRELLQQTGIEAEDFSLSFEMTTGVYLLVLRPLLCILLKII